MDMENKTLTIYDENGKEIKIKVMFTFTTQNTNKRYVVYTLDDSKETDPVNILISEVDTETYRIKEIPENEIPTVIEYYKQIKKTVLANE